MKSDIHPTVHKDAKTTCMTCGAVYDIPSTTKEYSVEACRGCHPIYTGKRQQVQRGGRIERFKKRMEASKDKKAA